MKGPSVFLRIAAVVIFILATVGVAPVPMTPLGALVRVDAGAVSGWRSTRSRG